MAIVPRVQGNRAFFAAAVCVSVLLACVASPPASGQNQKKKKNNPPAESPSTPIIPMTDEQQIDYLISGMLGAWQIGDAERMHQFYSDDVSVVKSIWEPPVMGWAKYAQLYKQERSSMEQVRLDRSNTFIWVNGNTAWACYQWDFSAVISGQLQGARGQTTLVLVKKDNRWLIVHDHSNVVERAQARPASGPTPGIQEPNQQKPGR
ncbi:MAG TPA: nuclear transport factor 2 family protein [Candidatus Acidoferrum sp.]|nr:nuclear transport factor 2 family protein [Candidatus Acidoferrum sp.]